MNDLPLVGALGLQRTEGGLVPRRLPEWAWPQLGDPALEIVSSMPAGVRLSFASGPGWVEIDAKLTGIQVLDDPYAVPAFDVVVDGEVTATVTTDQLDILRITGPGVFDLVPGGVCTVRLDLPTEPGSVVEVWLPHSATVELRDVRVADGARLVPAARTGRRWVHHGSSISHCLEAPRPTATWPAVAALKAGVELTNLGFAGQCMLDQHSARTIRDLDADLISLKAGINVVNGDTMRERTYRSALHGFLDTVRDGHPQTPFVLVTPIICPAAEDHPGPTVLGVDGRFGVVPRTAELSTGSLTLQRIRELMAEVVAVREDPHLHLLDGLSLFGPDDVADLPDALHPNPAGYQRMGERFYDLVFARGAFAV